MEYQKPIYKERQIDLRATALALGVGDCIILPYTPALRVGAVRTAMCRLGQEGSPKFSVCETINGCKITRTV